MKAALALCLTLPLAAAVASDTAAAAAPGPPGVRELVKKDGATYRLDVRRGQEHLQVRLTPHRLV